MQMYLRNVALVHYMFFFANILYYIFSSLAYGIRRCIRTILRHAIEASALWLRCGCIRIQCLACSYGETRRNTKYNFVFPFFWLPYLSLANAGYEWIQVCGSRAALLLLRTTILSRIGWFDTTKCTGAGPNVDIAAPIILMHIINDQDSMQLALIIRKKGVLLQRLEWFGITKRYGIIYSK